MKVAVFGSRGVTVPDLEKYLPLETSEIILGGANGINASAIKYALANDKILTEFRPEKRKYSRTAPFRRYIKIIRYADLVLTFWDGNSLGTRFVIEKCNRLRVPIHVFV